MQYIPVQQSSSGFQMGITNKTFLFIFFRYFDIEKKQLFGKIRKEKRDRKAFDNNSMNQSF